MTMGTSWTDDEYARVAMALLYPPSRTTTVLIAFAAATSQLGYALDAKLQQLSPTAKGHVLELADGILAAVREKHESVGGCGTPDVIRVGDIQRDPRAGQQLRASEIDAMRAELALLTDHYVNPRAAGATSGGGINGSWCT